MNNGELTNLVNECGTVARNSLFNAQANYLLAESKEKLGWWLLVAPSVTAGTLGLLVAVGLPTWLGAIAAAASAVAAVSATLGIDKQPTAHKIAASQWTALRHEARSLQEVFCHELPHEQFRAEVRRIDDRYNSLCQALPPTDRKSFEAARKLIEAGTYEVGL